MRALTTRPTRSANFWAFGTLAVLSALCGYAVAETEVGYAVAGGLILVSALVLWLLAAERSTRSLSRVDPADAVETALFRVPRAAFLIGLLLIGQLAVRPFYATTASDYLFFVALVTMVGGLLLSPRKNLGYVPAGLAVGAALFAAGACVSAFSSDTASASLGVTVRVLYLTLIWFWVSTVVLRRVSDLRMGVAFWVVSLSVSGAAAVAQLLLGDVIPGTDPAFGRMTGTAQHVNDLGGSAAVALPAAAGLALQRFAGRPIRLSGAVGTVLITTALVLSGSIGGMIAAAFGMGVAAVVAGRKRSFALIAAVIATATLITWHFQAAESADTITERLDAVGGTDNTLAARIDGFRSAWAYIADQPLVGVGLGFDPASAEGQVSDLIHNAFLGVWYQAGILALVGFVLICLSGARAGLLAVAEAEGADERVLAGALMGSFAAYLAFGLGAPTLYARYGWVPIAFILALRAIQRQRSKAGVAP